jgi:general secretion pathway protein K
MSPRPEERGAALLTVLMLVALIATLAATVLDRLTVSTRLAANSGIAAQGRQWLAFAEQLAAVRLEDLAAADRTRTLAGPWLAARREVRLPDGGLLTAEVRDGGNCFNLNSMVRADPAGGLMVVPRTVQQFSALLGLLGSDKGEADGIAEAAADWIDSDDLPLGGGAEAASYGGSSWRPSNALMADESELLAVRGMTPELYSLAEPFVCALPDPSPSAINPNTLLPEQAVLVAMLAPGAISVELARALIAARPAAGWDSSVAFWAPAVQSGVTLPEDAASQIKLKSRWFELLATVDQSGQQLSSTSLIDVTPPRARIVRRRYGEGA